MKTQIQHHSLASTLEKAKKLLQKDELVVIPTETVYGLAALFSSVEAKKKIYQVKKRPADNPLIVHVSSVDAIINMSAPSKDLAYQLARLSPFFPGPLTVVTKKSPTISDEILPLKTIAFRIPRHRFTLRLLHELNEPLVAPSANVSGRPSPTCPLDALADLSGNVPLIVDGGPACTGIESTVLDLTQKPQILRPGPVTKEMLSSCLGETVKISTSPSTRSPGNKYVHYAPKAAVHLIQHPKEIERFPKEDTLFLSFERELPSHFQSFEKKNLYSLFRKADTLGKKFICICKTPLLEQEEDLMNRIEKACQSGR